MDIIRHGILINSALYLVAVFYAGLWTQNPWAWKGAIATLGVTYLSYFVQVAWSKRRSIAGALVGLSIGLGVLAGLALLIGAS